MFRTIIRQWFLWALSLCLVLGMAFPDVLAPLTRWTVVRDAIVGVVLFLTTLPLAANRIVRSVRSPLAPMLATVVNLGLIPACAAIWIHLVGGRFSVGLMVVAATPCTIASAAVWTRRAGGNEVVALMVTVLTNLICFVVTPFWLTLALGQTVDIDGGALSKKLALLVLLPMLLAQFVRRLAWVPQWVQTHQRKLSMVSQWGILSILLVGAVHCGVQLKQLGGAQAARELVGMLLVVQGLHCGGLVSGMLLGRMCGVPRADWIAVGIAGSQKTLMLGLQVALLVGGGWAVLPMVAYHVQQLVTDTLVADRLRQMGPTDPAAPTADPPHSDPTASGSEEA